jgi:hypothetical protein
MIDLLILEGYLNAWVQGNPNLSAGVVERKNLFSMVDSIIVFECVNLWASYQMKHLRGGLGNYADVLLFKLRPDLVLFLKERDANTYELKFEFGYGDSIYRTRQMYY